MEQKQTENFLPQNTSGGSGLTVPENPDAEPCLPSTGRTLECTSPEFEHELKTILPPSAAAAVAAELRLERNGYRRYEFVLFTVLLCIAVLGAFCLFPKPVPPMKFKFAWVWHGPSMRNDSPCFAEYRTAMRQIGEGKLSAALITLDPAVDALLKKRHPGENGADRLLYTYFLTALQSGNSRHFTRLKQYMVREPDALYASFFAVQFVRQSIPPGELFRGLAAKRYSPEFLNESLEKIDWALGKIAFLRKRLAAVPDDPNANGKTATALSIDEAWLLTCRWLILGGRSGFHDNEDSAGVDERERAWKIASAPQNRRLMQFRQIELFQLDVLLREGSGWYNDIWFSGKYCKPVELQKKKAALERLMPGGPMDENPDNED